MNENAYVYNIHKLNETALTLDIMQSESENVTFISLDAFPSFSLGIYVCFGK